MTVKAERAGRSRPQEIICSVAIIRNETEISVLWFISESFCVLVTVTRANIHVAVGANCCHEVALASVWQVSDIMSPPQHPVHQSFC